MKNKLLYIFFFVFLIISFQEVKANLKIEYYFQEDETYVLNPNIDVYYNPTLNIDTYPEFSGYVFARIENDNGVYKLYYDIKTYDIIINGNGGLTSSGENQKVIAKVKHGEIFKFNSLDYKDLFSYDGYELIDFKRNFKSKITVTDDVIINCIWQPNITYKFIINGKEYAVSQIKGKSIVFPNIGYNDNFIGWFDEEQIVDVDAQVEKENKTLYGKYLYDFIDTRDDKIIVNKNSLFTEIKLYQNGEEILGSEEDNKIVFSSLNKEEYKLQIKFGEEIWEIVITTSSNNIVFAYQNKLIYNSQYQYLLDGQEVMPINGLIDKVDGITVTSDDNIISEYQEVLSRENLISAISSHAIRVKKEGISKYYFYSDCDDVVESEEYIYFYGLNPDTKYYFIYQLENDENFYLTLFTTLNFNIDVFNKKIVLHDAKTYKIQLGEKTYTPDANDSIIISSLEPEQEYQLKINHNGFDYVIRIKTNDLLSDFIDYKTYQVGYNYIKLEDLPQGYKYYLLNEGYNPINGELAIYNLTPNTNYTLFCVPINAIQKNETLFLEFKTLKIPQNKIEVLDKKVSFYEIEDTYVTFKNNSLYEYSVNQKNWYSDTEEKITITNIMANTSYILYSRLKETEQQEASKIVIVGEFSTKVLYPTYESFVNLEYTDTSLSFEMLPGYKYYFNNEEIILSTMVFKIDDLWGIKTCTLKVERIIDLASYEVEISLRELNSLSEKEKKIEYTKTYASLTIANSQSNFTYYLYLDNVLVATQKGNNTDLLFTGLNSHNIYEVRIKKDSDEIYFYQEEKVENIYIPGDIVNEINIYLKAKGKTKTQSVLELIEEYTEIINETKSEEEYQKNKLMLIREIDAIYVKTNLFVALICIFVVIVMIFITYLYKKKRKSF